MYMCTTSSFVHSEDFSSPLSFRVLPEKVGDASSVLGDSCIVCRAICKLDSSLPNQVNQSQIVPYEAIDACSGTEGMVAGVEFINNLGILSNLYVHSRPSEA